MGRAWVFSGLPAACLRVVLVLLACASLVAAQTLPKPRAAAPVPRQIILPSKLVAGEQATLAVIDTQGRLLPNVAVELPGGQTATTDATGRVLFRVPLASGTLYVRIPAQSLTATAKVVPAETAAAGAAASSTGAKVLSYPHVLAIHDRFNLEGAGFRGAAEFDRVSLNGEQCLVVASSPAALVVLPGPKVPIGALSLRVTVAGADAGQFPVSSVLLEFTGPAEAVNAGAAGELVVHARGTTEPLTLEVRNASPGVIQLTKGNVQRLKTSGGEENSAPVAVKFLTSGNYAVFARLLQ